MSDYNGSPTTTTAKNDEDDSGGCVADSSRQRSYTEFTYNFCRDEK